MDEQQHAAVRVIGGEELEQCTWYTSQPAHDRHDPELTDRDVELAVGTVVRQAFEGRTGHGGGPCTRRVLTEEGLRRFAHAAIRQAASVHKLRRMNSQTKRGSSSRWSRTSSSTTS